MSIRDKSTHAGHTHHTPEPGTPQHTLAGKVAAVTRIAMGLLFLWAFADKAFGWGYATPAAKAWTDGGSPTKGFLSGVEVGPFAETLRSWAGAWWADWLFMLGLLGIGIALLLGIGLRLAALTGTLMMLLMWIAEWPLDRFTEAGEPTRSTNPLIEYHVIYALVLILLAAVSAGHTWGLGHRWTRLTQHHHWLH
ncbi:DoxX family membrane protein [Amycolatopsis cihanbeyliensis]|uniref:Thiosulfate dehydrogenase [quinone] large subunit n=1 Tax=Amycolatopsis cihanbeyliensis TaxID=1128664 RepID=A0A542DE24_AMYCI|nr:DoxX family membrane protein [Amycolatopsis cihanbeyliensis]TQJ01324.1 thiosulfate dehydrogenase [quinone] large subunit [Amycolatopsis cihanbeyliensis]